MSLVDDAFGRYMNAKNPLYDENFKKLIFELAVKYNNPGWIKYEEKITEK